MKTGWFFAIIFAVVALIIATHLAYQQPYLQTLDLYPGSHVKLNNVDFFMDEETGFSASASCLGSLKLYGDQKDHYGFTCNNIDFDVVYSESVTKISWAP